MHHFLGKVKSKKLRFYVLSATLLVYWFGILSTAILKAAPSGIGAPPLLQIAHFLISASYRTPIGLSL